MEEDPSTLHPVMKISVALLTEAWLQPRCKQFASEEFEMPHSVGLADEGHSSLSLQLLFLQHTLVTMLIGIRPQHRSVLFYCVPILEVLFSKFPYADRVCDIFFLPVLNLPLY